jgi:hypothetical protein
MMHGLQGRNPPCRQAHGFAVRCSGIRRMHPKRSPPACELAHGSYRYFQMRMAHYLRAEDNKEEHSSAVFSNGLTATNALPQLTPSNGLFLLFVWLSALFPLHLCTDCTVMSGQILLHSLMLSPDLHSLS